MTDPWRQPAIWVAARLALNGRSEVLYSDIRDFGEESIRLGALPDMFAINAPTSILPFVPLALLDIDTARTLWTLFSILCLLSAWVLLLRALRLPLLVNLALSALLPLFQPLRRNTYLGEEYTVLLLLAIPCSLAALSVPNHTDPSRKSGLRTSFLSGSMLAFACIIRHYYGLIQFLPFLVRQQWRIAGIGGGLYGIAVFGTLIWLGADSWLKSIQFSLTWKDRPETAVTAYQSLNNFLTHLFRYHPTLNPQPVLDIPWLVGPLWWMLVITVLLVSIWAIWRSQSFLTSDSVTVALKLLPYTLAIPLGLLLAPVSEDYHFVQTLFPLLVVGASLSSIAKENLEGNQNIWTYAPVVMWAALVVAVVLLAVPWRFYNVPGADGLKALLYYPRLYGNLLLWALNLILLILLRGPASFRVEAGSRVNVC